MPKTPRRSYRVAGKPDKIVLKIFDARVSGEKRPHNCNTCQAYKREIAKGNSDALEFYKAHINDWIRKYNGATIVLNAQATRPKALLHPGSGLDAPLRIRIC